MAATATSIFKIRAISDFLAPKDAGEDCLLSFRKSQAFYVLSTDTVRGLYFVSTQYATPFSRTAVSGLVPVSHFEVVDLLSKDPAPPKQQSQPSQQQHVAAAVAGTTVPANAAEKTVAGRQLRAFLQANTRRYSEGALLAPPPLHPDDAELQRRAGTVPRNAYRSRTTTTNTATRSSQHQQHKQHHQKTSTTKPTCPPPPQKQAPNVSRDRFIYAEIISTIRQAPYSSTHVALQPPHQNLSYSVRVVRQYSSHIITRSFDDFVVLHNSLVQFFGAYNNLKHLIPTLPARITLSSAASQSRKSVDERIHAQQLAMEEYLSSLCDHLPPSMLESGIVAKFFTPRTAEEAAAIESVVRRDSGFSAEGNGKNPHQQQKQQQQQQQVPPPVPAKDKPVSTVENLSTHLHSTLSISQQNRCSRGAGSAESDFDAEDFLDSYVVRSPVY
ncbi:uncharacterized protein SPPG_04487 [Spizellomyces punctatus DAOM BR117]|uniref:PX domain-containing protein n=1 Tax=Spizellomyces punctatus (strain DAOM BR117) TaxID=645134 RepID=A0A0L0HFA9_SPIPD|nr:uncharacterized protein SPPG_04487 [Spizellomyces punctatus DAOM BR117]KND00146.1 hypothetical protein SPPG_04487 [Spizellomyces punctatus DAOM BR117]|eukprot:XP_016608185.1 hypothetical protein SPPG_04487 [Spizellomyces punctatus DAOM BR117]